MSRWSILAAGLCLSASYSPAASAPELTAYSWKPVAGAAYYVGALPAGSKFRTNAARIITGGGMPARLVAYDARGKRLGAVSGEITAVAVETEAPPVASPAVAAAPQPVPSPAPAPEPVQAPPLEPVEVPASEPEEEPAVESPPRPLRFVAAGTLGRERLDAEGGFSKFGGAALVGGARFALGVGRPEGPDASRLSYGVAVDYRRFSFSLKERLLEDPTRDREVKERLNLYRATIGANVALWSLEPGADLAVSAGLAYEAMPTLVIKDRARGETRLGTARVASPVIGFSQTLVLAPETTATAGVSLMPVAFSGAEKASALEAALTGTLPLAPAWRGVAGLSYRTLKSKVKLACPGVINVTATCRAESDAASALMQAQLGVAWTP